MSKLQKSSKVILIILFPLFLSGCFSVRVIEDIERPDRYFLRAYKRIERIHKNNPEREGRPHRINVLIYDSSEQKLIKFTAPFWLFDACMDVGIKAAEEEEFDFEENYEFDWRELKNLDEVGPGLLVEVDDEKNKILIWFD